jgi:hypothetical protein
MMGVRSGNCGGQKWSLPGRTIAQATANLKMSILRCGYVVALECYPFTADVAALECYHFTADMW